MSSESSSGSWSLQRFSKSDYGGERLKFLIRCVFAFHHAKKKKKKTLAKKLKDDMLEGTTIFKFILR